MADNTAPFLGLVTGQGNPPMNQQTQDLNRHLIDQMTGRYQADHMPNPGGPYGWMGAAADMGKIISTPLLANAYRRAQYQINSDFADKGRNARYNMGGDETPPAAAPGAASPGAGAPIAPPSTPTASPLGEGGPPSYKDVVKAFENRDLALGKTTTSKASWDYKQYTNGFGTKALSPNEVIDAPTSHARFEAEWNKAAQLVAAFPGGQNLDSGTKAALTSLTFNSGTQWMQSGLGQAIQNGDIETARKLFLQYNRAGGKENEGLKARREREAMWFGHPDPSEQAQIDPTGRMNATAPGAPPELPPTGDTKAAAPGAPPAPPAAAPDATPGTEEAPPGATPPVRMAQVGGSPNTFAGPGNGIAAPNLENSKQFHDLLLAYINMGVPPQQAMEYVQDIIKRSGTQMLKGPMGDVPFTNRPADQGGPTLGQPIPQLGERQITHMTIGPLSIPMMPYGTAANGEPVFRAVMPDGSSKIGTWQDLYKDVSELVRQEEGKTKFVHGQAEEISKDVQEAIQQGSGSSVSDRYLSELKALNLNPATSRGPTAQQMITIRQFLANYAPDGKSLKGTPDSEVMEKLNLFIAAENAKSLGNRVSNFNLEQHVRNTPGLKNTQAGAAMLIDLMQQDLKAKQELGVIASNLPSQNYKDWNTIKNNYYKNHYPIIHEQGYAPLHLGDFGTGSEAGKKAIRDKVKVGERFYDKDTGQIMTRNAPAGAPAPATP